MPSTARSTAIQQYTVIKKLHQLRLINNK